MTVIILLFVSVILIVMSYGFITLNRITDKNYDKIAKQLDIIVNSVNENATKFGYVYGKLDKNYQKVAEIDKNLNIVNLKMDMYGLNGNNKIEDNTDKCGKSGESSNKMPPYVLPQFMNPDFLEMDLSKDSGAGFFGYLLRCKKDKKENIGGDYVFIKDTEECFERMSDTLKSRQSEKTSWVKNFQRYEDVFMGSVYSALPEYEDEFIGLMTGSDEEKKRRYLKDISSVLTDIVINNKYVPIYGVTHIEQVMDNGHIRVPHMHILWGARKIK